MFSKPFLATALVMAGMFLLGCENSSTIKTLTAKVEGMGDKVDKVHLVTTTLMLLTETEFKDDRFSMEFPETVPSGMLYTVEKFFNSVHIEFNSDELTVSDAETKCCMGAFATSKNGFATGGFQYGHGDRTKEDVEPGSCEVLFLYVDRDVKITGAMDDKTFIFNCNLKKGWNYIAIIVEEIGHVEITTTLPEGLEWTFSVS